MVTLHIEHPVTDFATWTEAFEGFTEARRNAGVRAHRVHRPVDDDRYVVVDLDFETVEAAAGFREFLRTVVWARPEMAPGLAGEPQTSILEVAQV